MRIRSRWLNWTISALAVVVTKFVFFTCRKRIFLYRDNTCPYINTGDDRYLYCIWHDQLIMTIFSGKPKHMCGLTSQHGDGSLLADAMKLVNIRPVRGSSSRGGATAMREMMKLVEKSHVAITPDGPRGPRREAKEGLTFLAKKSGCGIIPITYLCNRSWHPQGKWTDMMLPKPFTKIWVIFGEPIFVPDNASREELAHYSRLLQERMELIEQQVYELRDGADFEELRTATLTDTNEETHPQPAAA